VHQGTSRPSHASARRRERRRYAKPGGETYAFRLSVAGNESNSSQARGNLARLCEEHIKGRYKIDAVDVLKDAAGHN
jgi:KaiB domain